jgi:uncharacterized protein (TIGR04222 family)
MASSAGTGAGTGRPAAVVASLNPLDAPGPLFLVMYAGAFMLACALAWAVRSEARGPSAASPKPLRLDPYAVAYLNGGPVLAVNTAVACLAERGLIDVRRSDATLRAKPDAVAAAAGAALEPLERHVLSAAYGTAARKVSEVRAAVAPQVRAIADDLEGQGLLIPAARGASAQLVCTLVALTVPAVGVAKILVGLWRDRPIGYLAAMVVISVPVALLLFARRPHRTRRGDLALDHLRTTHGDLKSRVRRLVSATTPAAAAGDPALALGMGLFGLALLDGTDLSSLKRVLTPQGGRADGSGSGCGGGGCGTSCGGGGGGGGGCGGGGGGCGGGGCGGCGGS